MRSWNGVALLLLAVLAIGSGQQPNCDLADEGALSDCVQTLLLEARPDVRSQYEPLRLPDQEDCSGRKCTKVWNARVEGLSNYEVQNLQITFPEQTRLAVEATISWPQLRANMEARIKAWTKKVFGKRLRASASGSPQIRLKNPTGQLSTSLSLHFNDDGSIQAVPQDTRVSISFSDLDLKLNFNGIGGLLNRLFGDPISKITEYIVERQWRRKWQAQVEQKAREALEKAIVDKLGVELSKLLH